MPQGRECNKDQSLCYMNMNVECASRMLSQGRDDAMRMLSQGGCCKGGVTIRIILQQGGWVHKQVFARFVSSTRMLSQG